MASDPAFAQATQPAVERAIVKRNGLGNSANPIVILGAQLMMPTLTEIV